MATLLQNSEAWIEPTFVYSSSFSRETSAPRRNAGDGGGLDEDDELRDLEDQSSPERQTEETIPSGLLPTPEKEDEAPGRSGRICQVVSRGGDWGGVLNKSSKKGRGGSGGRIGGSGGGSGPGAGNRTGNTPNEAAEDPPYLIISDGRHSCVAYPSPAALSSLRAVPPGNCLLSVGRFTVSTALTCLSGRAGPHSRLLDGVFRSSLIPRELHGEMARSVHPQLYMCLYLQGPAAVMGAENMGLAGRPRDVHTSVGVRRILAAIDAGYSAGGSAAAGSATGGSSAGSAAAAGTAGPGRMREGGAHARLVEVLEAAHRHYLLEESGRRAADEGLSSAGYWSQDGGLSEGEASEVGGSNRGRNARRRYGRRHNKPSRRGDGRPGRDGDAAEESAEWPWPSRLGALPEEAPADGRVDGGNGSPFDVDGKLSSPDHAEPLLLRGRSGGRGAIVPGDVGRLLERGGVEDVLGSQLGDLFESEDEDGPDDAADPSQVDESLEVQSRGRFSTGTYYSRWDIDDSYLDDGEEMGGEGDEEARPETQPPSRRSTGGKARGKSERSGEKGDGGGPILMGVRAAAAASLSARSSARRRLDGRPARGDVGRLLERGDVEDVIDLDEFEDCVENEEDLARIGDSRAAARAGEEAGGRKPARGEDGDRAQAETDQLTFGDGGGGDLFECDDGEEGKRNDDVASFVGIDDMMVDDTQSEEEVEEGKEEEEDEEGPLTQAMQEEPSDNEGAGDGGVNGQRGAGHGGVENYKFNEDDFVLPARNRRRRPVKTIADDGGSYDESEEDGSDDDVELVKVVPASRPSATGRATRSRTRREAGLEEAGDVDAVATSRAPSAIRTRSMGLGASPTKERSGEEEPDESAPMSQVSIPIKTRAAPGVRRAGGVDGGIGPEPGKDGAEEASEGEEPAVLSQVPILIKTRKRPGKGGGGSPAPSGSARKKRVRISEEHRPPRLGETDNGEGSGDDRADDADGGGAKPRGDVDDGTSRIPPGGVRAASKPGAPSPVQDSDRENNSRRAAGSRRDLPPPSPANPRTSSTGTGGRAQKKPPASSPARPGKRRRQPRAPTIRRVDQSPLRIRRWAASARRRDDSDPDEDDFLAAFKVRRRGPAGGAAAPVAAGGRGEAGPAAYDRPGRAAAPSSQESEVLLSSQGSGAREEAGGDDGPDGPGRRGRERLGRVDVAGVIAGSSRLAGGTRRRGVSDDGGGNAAGLDLADVIAKARSLCGL